MRNTKGLLYWLPRILSIATILFISMFALDSFEPQRSFLQQIAAFLIHLIPSFVLILVLVIAWRRELTGGIIFTLIGVVLSPLIYLKNYNMNHSALMSFGIVLMITFPFIVAGVLFIFSHFRKKSKH